MHNLKVEEEMPNDGMARITFSTFVREAVDQILLCLVPSYHLSPGRRKKHSIEAGFEPGPPAIQATALSITPWLPGTEMHRC